MQLVREGVWVQDDQQVDGAGQGESAPRRQMTTG